MKKYVQKNVSDINLEDYLGEYEGRQATVCENIFTSDTLDISRIDAMAMQIHHMYTGGPSAEEDWAGCSYWGRLSSRASADYYYSILKASGKTAEQVLEGDWPPEEEMLENLAISEHLRWNAFHIVNGYRPMPESEMEKRIAARNEEITEKGFFLEILNSY